MEPATYNYSLEDAFFPVDFRTIYWKDTKCVQNLWGQEPRYIKSRCFRAIVALDREEMLAAVTDLYLLITNKEAYDWAKEIAKEVFHVQAGINMKCLQVKMPKSRASCEIDLARNVELAQKEINDFWQAFIHIENSYNKTKKLSYDIGFYNPKFNRKLIDPNFSISVSEAHIKGSSYFHEKIIQRAKDRFAKIDNIEKDFYSKIVQLKNINIAPNDMIPLFCKFNNINIKKLTANQLDRYIHLYEYLSDMVNLCVKEFGPNAYCMLNVMTDYATNYKDPMLWLHSSSKQLAVGKWVDDIIDKYIQPDFSMHDYIGKEAGDTASWLQTLSYTNGSH